MYVGAPVLTVRVGCEFRHTVAATVPAIFLVRPAHTAGTQMLEEHWITTPAGAYRDYSDLYGNMCRRVTLQPGLSTIAYDARVTVDARLDPVAPDAGQARVEDLPDDVLVYTLPSRYCLSDEIADFAWERFGSTEPGWARVQAICDEVHEHVTFAYGSSTARTTSSDVLASGSGVCRDFTHLAIAFARAMSVPARYVFGYLPDIGVPAAETPMDFCAWFEAFLDGRWWTFDPRNNVRRRGRIVIARGRDALDVAMVTTYGSARLDNMTVVAEQTS